MTLEFEPRFNHFQQDIERYLKSIGKREKLYDGTIMFTGYDAALDLMFERYVERKEFGPLVEHFRRWNWELSYNKYLLRLTSQLLVSKDWPDLQKLWGGVLKKRKMLYNDMWKIERKQPGKIPESSFRETKERLIESLQTIIQYANELGASTESDRYQKMLERVKTQKKA